MKTLKTAKIKVIKEAATITKKTAFKLFIRNFIGLYTTIKYLSCVYATVKNCSTVSNPLRTNILNTERMVSRIYLN